MKPDRVYEKTEVNLVLLSVCFVFQRYFQCQPKYGLFAPVHKVTKIGFPSTTPAKAKTTVRKVIATPTALKRSPSASSLSSLSSVASSVSSKPSRTGLVSFFFYCMLYIPKQESTWHLPVIYLHKLRIEQILGRVQCTFNCALFFIQSMHEGRNS